MPDAYYPKPGIVPPDRHPRLMLQKKDIEKIKEKLKSPKYEMAAGLYRGLLESEIKGCSLTPEFGTYNLHDGLVCEAMALDALLSGEREKAEKAVSSVIFLLDNLKIIAGIMGARYSGHYIFVAAEVYDWCYDYLTDEQKNHIIAKCEELASAYFEMGYPPVKQTAITGHGCEAQLLRDLFAFSIAVYDERPDIYDTVAGRLLYEYVPSIEKLFECGANTQGPTYGSYRWTWMIWSELLFRAMGSGRIFRNLDKIADWLLYMLRPDGECVRLGDDFNETKSHYNRKNPFTVPFFFAWALTGRTDCYDMFRNGLDTRFLVPEHHGMDYYKEGSWGEGMISPVSVLVFGDFSEPKQTEALPPYKYFGFPIGMSIYKRDDSYILMKIGEQWGGNHDHLDTGCFQIFRGKPLISDSGVYDSYNSPHRRQYLIRTVAHNCLTVERDDKDGFGEWKSEIRYDGGTRRPECGRECGSVEDALSEKYRQARVLSHTERDKGCELVGDLSPAYVHSCKKVTRRMTYDHSTHTFTLTDDVTSLDPSYKKTEHLHCQKEPEILGNTVIFENDGFSAVCKVLSPEGARIEKVGGPGHRFVVDGENFDPQPGYVAEEGWGEVRISPENESEHVIFRLEIQTFALHETTQ